MSKHVQSADAYIDGITRDLRPEQNENRQKRRKVHSECERNTFTEVLHNTPKQVKQCKPESHEMHIKIAQEEGALNEQEDMSESLTVNVDGEYISC